MAAGVFAYYNGPAPTNILVKITTTSPTVIAGDANYAIFVPMFMCSEIAGGTPNLTAEIYDGTTSYYLGSGGVSYIAKALTAKQSVLFDMGFWLSPGQFIRVTSSAANQIDVVGVQSLPNTQGN